MIYNKGIHPDCGKKYKFVKDILITPFYTESFCDELVSICEEKKKEFAPYIVYNQSEGETDNCPWDTLFFTEIEKDLFKKCFDMNILDDLKIKSVENVHNLL